MNVKDLLEAGKIAKGRSESRGMDLRMDLAAIIMQTLKDKGWAQRDLARAAGMTDKQVSELVHGDLNCTMRSVGRILSALDIRASLVTPRLGPSGGSTSPFITGADWTGDTSGTTSDLIEDASETGGEELEIYGPGRAGNRSGGTPDVGRWHENDDAARHPRRNPRL